MRKGREDRCHAGRVNSDIPGLHAVQTGFAHSASSFEDIGLEDGTEHAGPPRPVTGQRGSFISLSSP